MIRTPTSLTKKDASMLMLPRLSLVIMTLSAPAFATELQKMGCKEVEAIEAKCAEYDAASKSCDIAAAEAAKAQVAAAKKEQDECKKKHSFEFVLKCKGEIKKASMLVNTPSAALKSKVTKELQANPQSPCGQVEAIGNEQKLCKGPKKVVSTMKTNCIKDM